MRNKILIPILCIFAICMFVSSGFAAWTYTADVTWDTSISTIVPEWTFEEEEIISEDEYIEIDNSGNIVIHNSDGTTETVEGAINIENGTDSYNNGDVSIKVGVDEEGNLVLTEFTTTTNGLSAIFGGDGTVYLPTSITVNGEVYPVTGISEPLSINVSSGIFGRRKNTIIIPDTYTYICDNAFYNLTNNNVIFKMPTSITSIGSNVFNPQSNRAQTINYAGTQAQWNAIDKASNYATKTMAINYNS